MSETQKSHKRRVKEGWLSKYVRLPAIDIGSGTDPLPIKGIVRWDYQWTTVETESGISLVQCDDPSKQADNLSAFEDGTFATVYASHILEHLTDPSVALKEWWRVLQPGGYLIICVPHRDLYEMQDCHPSRWNPCNREGGGGHLTFWLPDTEDMPVTYNFKKTLETSLPNAIIASFKTLDDGYDYSRDKSLHPVGEYAIEAILLKRI